MTSDEDKKKTRRIDAVRLSENDLTQTSPPTGTGTGGSRGMSDGNTGAELIQPPDRFTLLSVLGEGSQGEVCKAFDTLLERHVAIKFPHRVGDEETAREILSEARKAARLNHPNVVTIYEVGFWKNRPFIAMELIDGVSLATVIKECGRISVERYARYARQILKALGAAHRSGLIHRDLKPHNVLLASDGTLKLTDFGVAHVRSDVNGRDATVNISISGTPAYMAPEQWLGKKPDARSDIYAFGCLSYKLLAGKNVFPSANIMEQHLETPAPRLRDIAPHVPENLDSILMKCLEKKPGARFQNSEELLHAIDAASQDEDGPGTAQWPAKPKKSQAGLIVIILLLIATGATGWLGFTDQGQENLKELKAALGIKEPKKPIKTKPQPKEISKSEQERQIAEAKGKKLLSDAEKAIGFEQRLDLAQQSFDLLPINSNERARAKEIIEIARAEKERTTEKMVTTKFESLLQEVKTLRTQGEIRDAEVKLETAQNMYESSDCLSSRGNDLMEIKLPLMSDLAQTCTAGGFFEDASSYFAEAGRIADRLKNQRQRDRFKFEAETCSRIARLQKIVSSQPRHVLHELASMTDLAKRFPATTFMTAHAWQKVGAKRRARKAIITFITNNPSSPLIPDAELLKKSLAN